MSKKVVFLALAVVLAAALAGGATMAWFTDYDASDPAAFTAGTVLIQAGVSTTTTQEMGTGWKLVDIYPREVVSAQQGTLPSGGSVRAARSHPGAVLTLETGNNDRNFFSLGYVMDEHRDLPGDPEIKEYWSGRGGEIVVKFSEPVSAYEDRLLLVVEDTWGAWPEEKAAVYVSRDGGEDSWIYAGEVSNGIGVPQSYCTVDVPEAAGWFQYVKVVDRTNPYNHLPNTTLEKWWKAADNDAFDLNAIMVQRWERLNWNPGDRDELKYFVRNTGSKKINVRAKLSGYWTEFDEDEGDWVPWTAPAEVVTFQPAADAHGWVAEGGFIYYLGELASGDSAELGMLVCLDDENTGNEYQGKRFVVTATFDAVQSSHFAPYYEWGVDLYGTP